MRLLTACGNSQETPPATPSKTQEEAQLIGQWRGSCVRKRLKNDNIDHQVIETFTFEDNKLIHYIQFFLNTVDGQPGVCRPEDELWDVEYLTNNTLGQTVTPWTSTEHTKIDMTLTKVRIKVKTSIITRLFNTSSVGIGRYKGYGQTNWVRNEWKDLTDIPDARTSFKIGTILPDIFQVSSKEINGNTQKILTWGDMGGNLDRDQRPLTLENNSAVRQSEN